VAVVSFADEEGARFNTPTFGSRALAGRLDLEEILHRRDDAGTTLAEAMAADGVDPATAHMAPAWLERLRGFLELHIDQSRDVDAAGAAAGVVRALASRIRVHAELRGVADHAGTTTRGERRDALAAAARLILAADALAEPVPGFVTTATRLVAEPNALSTIPAHVRVWIDARAPEPEPLTAWREHLDDEAATLASRTGVTIELTTQSHSRGVTFDPGVREALGRAAGRASPEVVCFAGHDAGVLAAHVPTGMVLVRNPTGVSHAPEEDVDLGDAAVAATVLLQAIEALA
jgi:N-carbamoyl-L-amino-acid hydrolase